MFVVLAVALFIFGLNCWLSITALLSLKTGVARINGREYRKALHPYEFWLSVTSKAAAAFVLFLYLISIFATGVGPHT